MAQGTQVAAECLSRPRKAWTPLALVKTTMVVGERPHGAIDGGPVGGLADLDGRQHVTAPPPARPARCTSSPAWWRGRVTSTRLPNSGRCSNQASSSRRRHDRADDDQRPAAPVRRRATAAGRSASAASTTCCSPVRRPLHDGRGCAGVLALLEQRRDDPVEARHAHVEDERAGEARQGGPVEDAFGLVPGSRGR